MVSLLILRPADFFSCPCNDKNREASAVTYSAGCLLSDTMLEMCVFYERCELIERDDIHMRDKHTYMEEVQIQIGQRID